MATLDRNNFDEQSNHKENVEQKNTIVINNNIKNNESSLPSKIDILRESYIKYELSKALRKLDRGPLIFRPIESLLKPIFESVQIKFGCKRPNPSRIGANLMYDNFIGLFAGISLGYIAYLLFIFTFSQNPHLSTLLSCYLILFGVFGLTISSEFRCIVLLTIPYLVASRVRWLLVLYASALTASKPTINFLLNSSNFRNSIGCILIQVSTNIDIVKQIIKAPLKILGSKIQNLIEGLNQALEYIRSSLNGYHFYLFKFTNIMENQSGWIRSLLRACKDPIALKNVCLSYMNSLYYACTEALIRPFNIACYSLRTSGALFCTGMDLLVGICDEGNGILESHVNFTSKEDLNKQMDSLINLMGSENMSLTMDPNYYNKFEVKTDQRLVHLLENKMNEFVQITNKVKSVIVWCLVGWTLLTLIQLFNKAYIFKRLWLTKDMYQNYYITQEFIKQVTIVCLFISLC